MAKGKLAKKLYARIQPDGSIKIVPRWGAKTTAIEKAKLPKKPRVRRRMSEVRERAYVPMKYRSPKGKKRSTRYERMSCSAGALAAQARLFPGAVGGPREICGPTGPKRARTAAGLRKQIGMLDPRAHRLLAYWRWCLEGKTDACVNFFRRTNPGKRAIPERERVDVVWKKNEGPGKHPWEWAAIQPHAGVILKSGTAKNPEAAAAAAEKVARDWRSNPGKFVKAIEEAIQEHEYLHHRMPRR